MKEQLSIPTDVRDLVERTIDQTEKAFAFFFEAARGPFPTPGAIALDFAKKNMANHFEFARKLSQARDLQETIALQAEFLRIQIGHASEFMRELTPKP